MDPNCGPRICIYSEDNVEKLINNARVCNVCYEARPEVLFDCRCCAISYCSIAHRFQDEHHMLHGCDYLYDCAMANWYLRKHHQLHIPDCLLNEANINDGLQFEKVAKIPKYSSEKWLETIVNLVNERLAFPLTIHHALKKMGVGEQEKSLSELTSLTIHIVHHTPMCDPRMWEFFLHQLPNLIELNLTFISQELKLYNKYNSRISVERCSDCKSKQRIITYNIQQPMHYHEYFSSNDYVQPDVVAVFDVDNELMISSKLSPSDKSNPVPLFGNLKALQAEIDKEMADSFTSFRNMTYIKHTIVILIDYSEKIIEDCVKSFHDARPINVLSPVQKNPFCGFSRFRGPQGVCCNKNKYLCTIQGKH
ncbi:unnamed protein product [Meganyctiphanes norvegica]|uniref:Mitochondrial splicing suppressor 51-like C-terminal domain-containing protein n=1 Tax=Meganyctiphanes norvegica TaxID=48144 RepID=A0AAV2RL83_MEGNR